MIRLRLVAVLLVAATFGGWAPPVVAQTMPTDELVEFVGADLNAFWRSALAPAGFAYTSPFLTEIDDPVRTGCGSFGPGEVPAFYCVVDQTIYLDAIGLAAIETYGDFAVAFVIAHEWAHHVQAVVGFASSDTPDEPGELYSLESELMADCFAGVWTRDADGRGLLDPGDVEEAMLLALAVLGDAPGTSPYDPAAHGTNTQRVGSFLQGYNNGFLGCDFSLGRAPAGSGAESALPPPADAQPPAVALRLPALIPATLVLPQGQPFRVAETGARSLDEIAAGFPDPAEARQLLLGWGWLENAFTHYASDGPPAGAAGWVELSLHRFATADGAADALPFYAKARMAGTALRPIDLGIFGDQGAALAGPVSNGNEVTIYGRRGNLLVRATAITSTGDPMGDAIEASLIPLRQLVDEPRVVSAALFAALPTQANVPAGLRLVEEHARSASTLVQGFANPAEAERLFQAWGWRESAARVFVAEGAGTAAGAVRLEAVVYRLADAQAAAEALPYFLDARAAALGLAEVAAPRSGDEARAIEGPTAAGREATVYVRVGSSLFRFTAIGTGDPMADLWAMLG